MKETNEKKIKKIKFSSGGLTEIVDCIKDIYKRLKKMEK